MANDETKPIDERALDAIIGTEEVEEPEADEAPEAIEELEPAVEGEEAKPEEKAEPEEEAPEVVEIEIDGELLEIPAKYKDHFMRTKDYTEKTQAVAAQRKEVEVQIGLIEQTRQSFEFAESIRDDVAKAEALEAQAVQIHDHLRTNVDNLSSQEITKLQLAITDARSERDEIGRVVQNKTGEFQQAREQAHRELLNKGTEVLRQRIPGWGEKQQKQVREYALNSGFTEAEIAQVVDPRHVEALYKASQYDALKSGVAPAVKLVQSTLKPKARDKMDQAAKDRLALNKIKKSSLSESKKADAIMESIEDRFS